MIITQTFPSNRIIDENELRRSKIFIKGIYKSIGYIVERISTITRVGLPIQYVDSDENKCQLVQFFPYLKNGKKARKLTSREYASLDLNLWEGWHFLGSKNSLIPLALKHSNISPSFVEISEDGFYMLSPNVGDEEALQILEIEESLYLKGVRRFTTKYSYDFVTALELLLMKGGSVVSFPSLLQTNTCKNKDEQYEFYCVLPEDYDMYKFETMIREIHEGRLPIESFTGFWNFHTSNVSINEIYSRRLVIHSIALLAYKRLSEEHSYLAPFIYYVTIGSYGEVRAPIVSLLQKLKFRDYLKFYFEQLPYEDWTIVPYENKSDLIVKRFIYEKFSEFVLAPNTLFAVHSTVEPPNFLIVYGEFGHINSDDFKEYKQELEELVSFNKSKEEICLPNCNLEKSICCIKVGNKRIEPSDLNENVFELSPLEEETLLKMDYGLRGYFKVGEILKGLLSEPPLNLFYEENFKANVDMQINFLLYLLTNEEIPVLNDQEREVLEADLKDQIKLLNGDMNVWKYAFINDSHLKF